MKEVKLPYILPMTDVFVDKDGNVVSLVEVLGGKELAIEGGHKSYKLPNTSMIVDAEGNLYNLIDVIQHAFDSKIVSVVDLPENPDPNTWYAIQE